MLILDSELQMELKEIPTITILQLQPHADTFVFCESSWDLYSGLQMTNICPILISNMTLILILTSR